MDLIPHLLTYNPNLVQTATSASRFLADEDDFLEEQAKEFLAQNSSWREDVLEVDVEALANAHSALSRRAVLLAIERVRGTRKDTYSLHVEDVMELIRAHGRSGLLSLPDGMLVRKRYGILEFGWSGALQPARIAAYMKPLRVPGLTVIPHSSKMLIAEVIAVERLDGEFKTTDPGVAYMDYDVVSDGLAVRNRRDGDRFRPLGMAGTKKLKEFFIDNKVRSELRDQVPLVVYGDEGRRIAWIGELRLSDDVKITEKTRRVLCLYIVPIGE
jgi:tRNA(Ile)-lysidine synthase